MSTNGNNAPRMHTISAEEARTNPRAAAVVAACSITAVELANIADSLEKIGVPRSAVLGIMAASFGDLAGIVSADPESHALDLTDTGRADELADMLSASVRANVLNGHRNAVRRKLEEAEAAAQPLDEFMSRRAEGNA